MKKVYATAGGLILFLLVLVALLKTTTPPIFTASLTIPEAFVTLLEHHSPTWAGDPVDVAIHLLGFGVSDPIDQRGMVIQRLDDSDGTVWITIDDHYVEDDSTSRIYDAVRLRRTGAIWIPFEHRRAQQGRDVFGWTTGPTS